MKILFAKILLIVDGTDPELVKYMETELNFMKKGTKKHRGFETMASLALLME